METTTRKPRTTFRMLSPLEKAIREFRNKCMPETNKVRMQRIENHLTTVYNFDAIENPTVDQQREYYKASRVLFQAGVC